MAPRDTPDLTVSRTSKARRSAVGRRGKTELLTECWAPALVVTVVRKHEFYPGGAFDTVMRLEDGTELAPSAFLLP